MKTTIYELLGMIKDGKAPEKILFESEEYVWNDVDKTYYCCDHDRTDLLNDYVITDILNKEVLILETAITYKPDKIEKLSILTFSDLIDMSKEELVDVIKEQRFKINEIIDKVNKLL